MSAIELFNDGKLSEAIEAAIAHVKSKPMDLNGRFMLVDLLCVAGDIERADKQLETIATQSESPSPQVSMGRQLIRAEMSRRECLAEGRVPEFVGEQMDATMELHLKALVHLRASDHAQAAELLQEAEKVRPQIRGTCNGQPINGFRDLDDLFGGVWEVLTSSGKYYWIPLERVISANFEPPTRPRDIAWRQVEMEVRDGPTGIVYVPVTYFGTHNDAREQLKLAEATEWIEDGPIVRGLGQRSFLIGDEDKMIMELEELLFEQDA